MMNDGKIIGTIIAMATDISAQYESIGIQSIQADTNGIKFILKDLTEISIPISGWHNLTTDEQNVLAKLVPLSNDGGKTYLGSDLNRYNIDQTQTNDNKSYNFTTSQWIQDTLDTTKYMLTIPHNLNDIDVIPYVKNSDGKAVTCGIDTSIVNKVILTSEAPFNGTLTLNFSSSNGNRINNVATINSAYIFEDNTARDTYFGTNYNSALQNGLVIMVGTTLYIWNGTDYPSFYNNALWSNSTALIKGEKGDQGAQGIQGIEGSDSCLGEFETLLALKTKYPPVTTGFPNGVNANKFAIINDVKGSGIVSIAFYDATTTMDWKTTKLNQAIPYSTSGDSIGFTGSTQARLDLINNVDWNTKTFLYYDTDIKCLLLYRPLGLCYEQYVGQKGGASIPMNPVDGQVFIGSEVVYVYDNTNKYWRVVLKDFLRSYKLSANATEKESINGASINFNRDGANGYTISIIQDALADKVHYSVVANGTEIVNSSLLTTGQSVTILSDILSDTIYDVSTTLKFTGIEVDYSLIRYDDTIFILDYTRIVAPSSAYMTMSMAERSAFKTTNNTSVKVVRDVTLETNLIYYPHGGVNPFWIQDVGQIETDTTFPTSPIDGQIYISSSSGATYTYDLTKDYWKTDGLVTQVISGKMSPADKIKLDSLTAPAKNNLTANRVPTTADDTSQGYSAGSTWVYSGITYTCTDATQGSAKWVSSADIYYADTWNALIALISVSGTTYVGKYFSVTNANGGASSGATYTAPSAVSSPIVDGGSATYLINSQGSAYSVTCLKRVITNPIIAGVMLTASAKSTTAGYYIFTIVPTDGLPSGCGINDICYFDGGTWSKFQTYATAPSVIIVGSSIYNQTSWRKFQGTWMNTADEYIPDGNEYQTGKTWNGKPVYRKCTQGTLPSSIGTPLSTNLTIPSTGILLSCLGTAKRNTSPAVRFSIGQPGTAVELYEDLTDYTIKAWLPSSAGAFCSQSYVAWVEYTKS